MNDFLARHAIKHMKDGLSRTWVLPDDQPSGKAKIVAYYTLTMATVSREEIPASVSLPKYPIPTVLLAKLAVDVQYIKRGIGKKMLIVALRKAVELSDKGLSAHALILDVLDDEALSFYKKFDDFKSFTNDPMRLFVPMSVLRKI